MKLKAIMLTAVIVLVVIGGMTMREVAIVKEHRITAQLIDEGLNVGMAKDALLSMLKDDACGGGEINWQNIGDIADSQFEVLYYKHHDKWTEGYTISIRSNVVKSIHAGIYPRDEIARLLIKQEWKYIQ